MAVTKTVFGTTVEIRTRAAKSHNFNGGWNGYGFYTDSKGVEYAVRNAPTSPISWERMMSE